MNTSASWSVATFFQSARSCDVMKYASGALSQSLYLVSWASDVAASASPARAMRTFFTSPPRWRFRRSADIGDRQSRTVRRPEAIPSLGCRLRLQVSIAAIPDVSDMERAFYSEHKAFRDGTNAEAGERGVHGGRPSAGGRGRDQRSDLTRA